MESSISDKGKVFIGGISWETSEERLKEYFGNYGEIVEAVVMRDKISGRPRGFGFVVFSDPSVLDSPLLLHKQHSIDGRTVEAKRALSREEQQVSKPNSSSSATPRTKKIFVGGLPPTLTEQGFRHYFEAYGHVTDVVVMYDQQTNRPRGFGFISFDSEDAVDRVLHNTFHDLNGKQVEVKRALPKDANPRSMDNRQGYYAAAASSYEPPTTMDSSNSYMQSQNAAARGGGGGGGYHPPSGYAYAPGPTNGMAYNSYDGYAAPPAANPTAPYGTGPPRTSWNAQPSSGYPAAAGAYGNAPWGASAPQAPAPTGQSPSAASYGNQAYGYGSGYGAGGDGSYTNPAGYAAVGGRIGGAPNTNSSPGVGPRGDMQSAGGGGGYMGSGYGDPNGNSGYGNSGWRPDHPSQASRNYGAQGNGGYGGQGNGGYGAYGGAPARQS